MAFGASMGMRAGSAIIRLGVQTGASGRRVDQLGRKVTTLRARFAALRRGFGEVTTGFQSIVQGMRPAVFAGAAASALGLREALMFDQEVANLTSVIGDLKDEAPAIKRTIKNLALDRRNAATAIEAAQAYTMMARSGVEAADRMEAASVSLRLAALDIKLSANDAAIFATKTAKQFGIGYEEIGDKLARAADAIPGNVNDIVTAMQYAAPVALQMGQGIDEALGMVMVAATRMRASRAGTSIGQFMTAFAKSEKIEAMNRVFKKFDMELLYGKTGKMREFGGVMDDLVRALSGMEDRARAEALYEIFGIRGTRAVTMFMKAAEKAGESYEEMLGKVRNGITLSEKAQNRAQGMMAQLKHIRTALGVIAIDFFSALFGGEGMGNFSQTIADVAKAFGMLVDKSGEAEKAQANLSEGVWSAARGIMDAVDGVRGAFSWLGEKISWVAGLFGLEGTREVTKFMVTFAAISPVILVVGMALSMAISIVRGLAWVFTGLGRAVWSVIGMYKGMVKWVWSFLSTSTAQHASMLRSSKLMTWWHGTMTKVGFSLATLRSKLQWSTGPIDRMGMRIKWAAGGLKAFGKGLLSVLGPAGLVVAAVEGLSALFGAFTSDVEEAKAELASPTAIDIGAERPGTIEAVSRILADPESLKAVGLGGLAAPGAVPEFAWGKGEETRAVFKRLLAIGKAGGAGDLAEEKLRALGLSTKQVNEIYQIHGQRAAATMNELGLALTTVVKTQEAFAKTSEEMDKYRQDVKYGLKDYEKGRDIVNKLNAEYSMYTQAMVRLIGVTEGGSNVIETLFREMDEAAKRAATIGAEAVDAGAEANAKAAQKRMKKCLDNKISLNVGGRQLASVVSRAQLDINERAGASVHPYQRHKIIQDGAEPVSGTA